jgi:hypothetical protein
MSASNSAPTRADDPGRPERSVGVVREVALHLLGERQLRRVGVRHRDDGRSRRLSIEITTEHHSASSGTTDCVTRLTISSASTELASTSLTFGEICGALELTSLQLEEPVPLLDLPMSVVDVDGEAVGTDHARRVSASTMTSTDPLDPVDRSIGPWRPVVESGTARVPRVPRRGLPAPCRDRARRPRSSQSSKVPLNSSRLETEQHRHVGIPSDGPGRADDP